MSEKKILEAIIKSEESEWRFPLNKKTFKTGSRGFHGFGKIQISDGTKYQVNILVVEIGSKTGGE